MKKTRLYIYLGFIVILLFTWFGLKPSAQDKDFSEVVKIALRDAGNQLLLTNKDSTSLILPVTQVATNKYHVAFNSELSFQPEDLVAITKTSLEKSKLPDNYRVEVLQCNTEEVAYSYEMKVSQEETIIPCNNRRLPENCYTFSVKFTEMDVSSFNRHWLLLLLAVILGCIGVEWRKIKSSEIKDTSDSNSETFSLGSFSFYPEQNKLVKAATEISLSKKECELLAIFVANKNQIVKRDELTKKVWEDHGVIVGRSLDTYISKLRKKLKGDDTIKLTNVHGVGYKLEVL